MQVSMYRYILVVVPHSFTKRSCFIRLDLCWADTKYGVDGSVPGDLTQPDDHEDHDLDFSFV